MRKFGVLTATIFISIIVAGIYGVIHDQITYSISPEYFTKFKYRQFGFEPSWFGGHRQTVAVIGFLATWWMGLFIGVVIGLSGLIFKDYITMRKAITKAIIIVFIVAILFAFIGFLWVKLHLTEKGADWWLPDNLVDRSHFIIVGSIHNFSYLGGVVGLVIAFIFMIMKNILLRMEHAKSSF
jgi:hypothetical protein